MYRLKLLSLYENMLRHFNILTRTRPLAIFSKVFSKATHYNIKPLDSKKNPLDFQLPEPGLGLPQPGRLGQPVPGRLGGRRQPVAGRLPAGLGRRRRQQLEGLRQQLQPVGLGLGRRLRLAVWRRLRQRQLGQLRGGLAVLQPAVLAAGRPAAAGGSGQRRQQQQHDARGRPGRKQKIITRASPRHERENLRENSDGRK